MKIMNRYRLIGAGGSPYSMKMRAILRYRRLPHDWILRTPEVRRQLAGKTKVELQPVLHIPWEDTYLIDSTPIAYDLEKRHPGERSIIPDDPAHGFLSALIEDLADEWVTKQMFHLRWEQQEDQQFSSFWIIADSAGACPIGRARCRARAPPRRRPAGAAGSRPRRQVRRARSMERPG